MESGAQVGKKRKGYPDVALVGMVGTIAAFCLFLGAFYEVNNEGTNTTLILIYFVFALLVSILFWYMALLRRQSHAHKANLDNLKRKVIQAKLSEKKKNGKPVGNIQDTTRISAPVSKLEPKIENDFDIPSEISESIVLPSADSDNIVMGFTYE